jgi:hypothetical protein
MSSVTYLEQISQDFSEIGLLHPNLQGDLELKPHHLWGWPESVTLLGCTEELDAVANKPDVTGAPVATDIARRAVELMLQPDAPRFKPATATESRLICCVDAEPKLIYSLSPQPGQNGYIRRPVIITDGDTPVAVVKTYGEKSCYALENNYPFGLVQGAFGEPERLNRFYNLPPARVAWRMDIEDLGVVDPRRFSGFQFPEEVRKYLAMRSYDDFLTPTLRYDHSDIQEFAANALASARPVDLKLLG